MQSATIQAADLISAIEDGSLKRVENLLRQGADVRAVTANGGTALHTAALLGEDAICAKLLESGAVANARNNAGNTPLHLAARKGHVKACGVLIKAGAKINARNDDDETPFDLAQSAGKQEVFTILSAQAKNSAAHPATQTPAPRVAPTASIPQANHGNNNASQARPQSSTQAFSGGSRGIQPIIPYRTDPLFTFQKGKETKLHKALDKIPSLHKYSSQQQSSRYFTAVRKVEELIKGGKVPLYATDDYGLVAFLSACAYLRSGPQICTDMKRIIELFLAREKPNKIILTKALQNLVSYTSENRGSTLLELAQKMIDNGAEVNAVDEKGNSALFYAATGPRYATTESFVQKMAALEFLLRAGAHVNQEGKSDERTCIPFFEVCLSGDKACRQLFLQAGADYNALLGKHSILTFCAFTIRSDLAHCAREKESAEGVCAKLGQYIEVIYELAPVINNINQIDPYGESILSYMCTLPKHPDVIQFLLKHKADATLIKPETYVCLDDDVKDLLEASNPQGVRRAFGTREEQNIKKQAIVAQRAQAATAQNPLPDGHNRERTNWDRAANIGATPGLGNLIYNIANAL